MIRSVKSALHVVLRDQAPQEEVLYTVLTEIEHSVNSRPLTHVTVDPRDGEALTPKHFLIGVSSGDIKLGRFDLQPLDARRQWKLAQHLTDAFWKRWLREYLPTIIARPKWADDTEQLKVGDLVLIVDFQSQRNDWKKGSIVDTYPGSDGVVRSARVRTPKGYFDRPTHKLIKLLGSVEVQSS